MCLLTSISTGEAERVQNPVLLIWGLPLVFGALLTLASNSSKLYNPLASVFALVELERETFAPSIVVVVGVTTRFCERSLGSGSPT